MKKLINSGLGAAAFLVFVALAAIFFQSCGNSDSKTAAPVIRLVTSHLTLSAHDSSATGTTGTGNTPKVYFTLRCPNNDCNTTQPGSTITAGGSSESASYVLEFQTTDAIPANTNLRLSISFAKAADSASAETKMSK
jgi:hypothetical protein